MLARNTHETTEALDLITIIIESKLLAPESLPILSMTSINHYLYILNWILKNLECLNDPSYHCMLTFLENIISHKDEQAASIAEGLLGNLSWSRPKQYNPTVLNRMFAAIQDCGLTDSISENNAFSNAAFFNNDQAIQALLENGFMLPSIVYKKVSGNYLESVEKGKPQEKHLMTCKVIIEYMLKNIVHDIKHKIKSHIFVLNGGGDNSIPEIGHAVTTHAAKVFTLADAALKSETSLVDTYYQLTIDMIREMRDQEKGWFPVIGMFTSRGERDKTTSDFYNAITKIIMEGTTILNEYTKLIVIKEGKEIIENDRRNCSPVIASRFFGEAS